MNRTIHNLAIISALILSGCIAAKPPQNEQWGRLDGAPDSDEDKQRFRQDEAACEYDVARMGYMAPQRSPVPFTAADPGIAAGVNNLTSAMVNSGPPVGMFPACMRARGWTRKG